MAKKTSKLDRQARALLLAEWNNVVRHAPPSVRLQWPESANGLVAHGTHQRKQLAGELRVLRRRVHDRCCSESWIDGIWHGGNRYRGRGMKMSRERVRYGEGLPHRRATPTPAVDLEDEVDGLSYGHAMFYDRPPSVSAVAIRKIGLMRGRELSAEELTRRVKRLKDRRQKLAYEKNMSAIEIIESIENMAKSAELN